MYMAGYISYFLGWNDNDIASVDVDSIEYKEFIQSRPYNKLLDMVIEELRAKFGSDVRYYNIKQLANDITGNIQKYLFLNQEQVTVDISPFMPIRVKKGLRFYLTFLP